MTRAQCIVHRGNRILLVKHRMDDMEWWCLPGGAIDPGELPTNAAIRELQEECQVTGKIINETSHGYDSAAIDSITYLIDIGSQEPQMGNDPEFKQRDQILVDMGWMTLAEIPERDRAYLWAAGFMCIPDFLDELSRWGDDISYPAG